MPEVIDFRERRPQTIEAKGRKGAGAASSSSTVARSTATSSSCPAAPSPPTSSWPMPARRSSTTQRAGSSCLPSSRRASRRGRGVGRRRVAGRSAGRPRQGQGVLRLLLRGPDGEGSRIRDRRGLRLDRAGQALHHRDDGPLPGQALPRELCARVREGARHGRGVDRPLRPRGRPGRPCRSAARRAPARAGQAHLDASSPQGAGRAGSCGRAPGGAPTPTGRSGGRGTARARVGRSDRRLDPRQDSRDGPRRRRLPRPPLPEPVLRPQDRPHPLRRPPRRRGPDHRRRDGRPSRRGRVLRDDDLDGRRRRLRVVRVVERRLAHGRRARERHGAVAAVNVAGPKRGG